MLAATLYRPISLDTLQQTILPKVFKPARYLGLEEGAYNKPWDAAKARMALVFPELYEIGISNPLCCATGLTRRILT
jgi:hypothetical protein